MYNISYLKSFAHKEVVVFCWMFKLSDLIWLFFEDVTLTQTRHGFHNLEMCIYCSVPPGGRLQDHCGSVASYLRSAAGGSSLPRDLDDVTIPDLSDVRGFAPAGGRRRDVSWLPASLLFLQPCSLLVHFALQGGLIVSVSQVHLCVDCVAVAGSQPEDELCSKHMICCWKEHCQTQTFGDWMISDRVLSPPVLTQCMVLFSERVFSGNASERADWNM